MSPAPPSPTNYAYAISLLDGETSIEYKESGGTLLPVWPVRGTSNGPSPVWKTGQTTSYASGDDGDWGQGVAWPEPRFSVEGDCGTDNLTGLVWSKNADLPNERLGWQSALEHANGLILCDQSDWRLPNTRELWSLVNFGQASQQSWLQGQGFTNARQDSAAPYYPYFTATTRLYQTNNAFGLRLDSALLLAFMKSPALGGE
jgi:hypothetical protein